MGHLPAAAAVGIGKRAGGAIKPTRAPGNHGESELVVLVSLWLSVYIVLMVECSRVRVVELAAGTTT